jgi:hypothetical protein
MKYISPYYGKGTLQDLKKRVVKELTREPCPIDPDALDIVLAINHLPFVVHTIESCSGHIKCDTGLPKHLEEAVKSYWSSIRGCFGDSNSFNKKLYRKFMQPKYQLAAYFFSSRFYERFFEGHPVPYGDEFIHQLPHSLKGAFLAICDDQEDPVWTNYWDLVNDPEQISVFEDVADFVYDLNPRFEIYAQLRDLATRITNLDDVKYCDWGWGRADVGPFLDILYVKSSIAYDFHQELAKLFRGKDDDVVLRYPQEMEILEGMMSGDPDATCIACFEPMSECDCQEEGDFPPGWTPMKELRGFQKLDKIQISAAYWKRSLKAPLTQAKLDRFWAKVWKLVRKYQ